MKKTCMTAICLSVFLYSCGQTTRSGKQNFAPKEGISKIKVGNSPGSVEAADFNHDNYTDLAITSETDSSVIILLGNEKGEFKPAAHSPFYAGSVPNDICIADFNKDNNLDLAFANHEKKYLTILSGDGKGNFTATENSRIVTKGIPHVHGIATGDFNKDGWLDFATDSWGNDQVEVIFGGPSISSDDQRKFFKVGKRPYQRLRAADLNGDHVEDIVTTNAESNNATLLLSDSKGGFKEADGSPFPCGDNPFGLTIGDINGDGKPDLAIINSPSSMAEGKGTDGLTVLINDGMGRFTKLIGSPFQAGRNPNRIAIGDVNGDGINDITTSDFEGNQVYLFIMNKGNQTIVGKGIPVGTHPKGIAMTDLNGDAKADIIVCCNADNNIAIIWGKD